MQPSFPWAWWSFDLGKYRPCDGTYKLYPYDSIPPLDEALFSGSFDWLAPARGKAKSSREVNTFVAAAGKLGVRLPDAFVRFMADSRLQSAVPSCTACEWDLSSDLVPCRVVPGAYTVRFLRDQQDCLFWYLHVLPDGEGTRVLCSPIPFDEPDLEVSREQVIDNTWVVAPHFEHFVYRFWIENELWDQLESSEDDLSPAQRAYVEHYARAKAARKAVTTQKVSSKKVSSKKVSSKKVSSKKVSKKAAN